jgi:hypothetical protein
MELKKVEDGDWIKLALDMVQWYAFVNMISIRRLLLYKWNLLTSC